MPSAVPDEGTNSLYTGISEKLFNLKLEVVSTAGTKRKKPDSRERLFCYLCAALGSPREAAVRAGYSPRAADQAAAGLLERADIRRRVEKCAKRLTGSDLSGLALRGLMRLAFGPANDAVRLMLAEDAPERLNPEELAGLDLFPVSEIRRPKGGGWEVKFHDRAQALQMLLGHAASHGDSNVGGFYQALRESAAVAVPEDEADAV